MSFPDSLEPFRAQAKELLQGQPEEVIFSGPTYQLRFDETWVFLQLDQDNAVKDLFCQNDSCAATTDCCHLAAALLYVYGPSGEPLHVRFERSAFSLLLSSLLDDFRPVSSRRGAFLRIGSGASSMIFRGPSWILDSLSSLLQPSEETEETSIKFSAISPEEMEGWRQGTPSQRLQYELSPLSDIAKKLFLLAGNPVFRFEERKNRIPQYVRCRIGGLECRIPCRNCLAPLLDRLPRGAVTPRIELFGGQQVSSITFDPHSRLASVVVEGKPLSTTQALTVGKWKYLPRQAFVTESPREELTYAQIAPLLEHKQPIPVSYAFDIAEDAFRLKSYLEQPGDLDEAVLFDTCVWTKKKGFVRIESLRFDGLHTVVPVENFSEFFHEHRHFLDAFPGYQVHDHPIEEAISYEVAKSGALIFHKLHTEVRGKPLMQLGEWTYVENEGFFSGESDPSFPFEIPIPPHRVGEFIRSHKERIDTIPDFFASTSPIQSIVLQIRTLSPRKIEIFPIVRWVEQVFEDSAILYDDIGFIQNIGFFSLPALIATNHYTRTIQAKDREEWERFFLEQLPKFKEDFSCVVDPRLEFPKTLQLVLNPEAPLQEQEIQIPAVWEVGLYWKSEKGVVVAEEVYKAFKNGERFLITDAGCLDLSEVRFGWLSTVAPRQRSQLRTIDFLKIKAYDDFCVTGTSTIATILERLLQAVPPTAPDLTQFHSQLRSYQQHGVEWLWHLYLSGLSGLLCDDMGVGKTHQAMGLLAAVKKMHSIRKTQFLIICPTSLLWHWAEKIAKTLPTFRVFTYFGGKRSPDDFTSEYDIFLTTYGIWRNDLKLLKAISFDVAIFDELQLAKNHVSQIWVALTHVKADMRLGLTGTPLENQLRELKALFDIILPSYLPPFDSYIIDHKDLLARLVRPFILRRRKQDVLPDLPAKTEDVFTAELVGGQKQLYLQIVAQQSVPILERLRDEGSPIPYMHIFALISALKQVCNHPAAYTRDIENYERYESGKWDTFVELLEEAQESGQKVVVFSQFLAMLDIIAKHLQSKNIKYTEIRGSTKARAEALETFQTDPSCQVFLGSLQAAGLGIDLTAASVVIHYDRWWNAARENQATDRVHRIGQTRGVLVYKIMTTGTIEERIDQIISSKAQLFEEVVGYDDHQMMKKLDRHELIDLLQNLDSV